MTVSAIVPARNEEATIASAVESLAAQPEISEIIVVNDQSTDGTAAELVRLSTRYAQLRVLETNVLPSGWVGKNYAVSLGAAQATGDWLLFTDADGVHLPGSTAHALADAAATGAGLVSYSPEQEMHTWWERALIPFIYTRLARNFSYDAVPGLSTEVKQKLNLHKPTTVGQASRISGITPAAISLLLIHLKKWAPA